MTKDEGLNKKVNPRYTKVESEANQGTFTIDAVIISKVTKIGIGQLVRIEEFSLMDKIEVDLGMNKITGMIIEDKILEVTREHIKILEDRIVEGDIEEIIEMKIITEKEVEVGLEKRSFSERNGRRNDRRISNSRSRSGSRVSVILVRKYDHFARLSNDKGRKGHRQIWQLFNLNEEQTSLKTLATNMYDRLSKINSLYIAIAQEHLNL